ncbi:hypothetical protein [Bacteroides sp. CACC 737]|uniref:hypothetical protein n=1 Tax=Bacteroides sp. CACC 737 TaxID=2755405 RepID=UPI0015EFB6D1|nr:hypothetical protein [Bacteroides sp. CACC 737]QMI81566.1 hypothetical protein H1A11_06880 [Bacteroides sp. CACC 737]
MKIRSLISLAMATFLITACSNENDEELISTSTTGILSATVEGNHSSTRAGFASDGKFYWSKKDQLGVTTSGNASKFTALNLTNGSGTASGTFGGTISGTIGDYAVYPCYDNHSINGATLTYNFPTSYTYNKVDADYFTTVQGEGNSFNPAMWGKIVNGAVQMKHLGGVFCIKVPKMPIKAGTLSLIVDKKITGTFAVNLNDNIPVIASTETSTSENNTVTIEFSGATQDQPGVFYVPVPTGTYDVRIKVTESQGSTEKVNVAAGTYTIVRCDLKKIELTNGNIDATVPTESSSLDDAATKLASNDAVRVNGEISGTSNTISVPAATSGTGKSLSLEKVASGASLTVLDANSSGSTDNSVDNFTLSIPNNEIAEFEPLDVTITMPNTTVALTGNAGAAIYGTVTSETADNTLVIGNGVEVKKVVVKKGNIRVNKGAKLVAIEKSSDNQATTVTVYKEDGAEIPSSLGEEFVVMDAAVADMQKVFAEGGTYTLPQDMNIVGVEMMVPKGKEVTLDLNGKTLEAANDGLIRVEGSFILQDNAGNGVIKATKDYVYQVYSTGIIYVDGEDAKMTMKSGNIYAVRDNPPNNGQFGIGLWRGADLTIEGGKIEAGWYAVSGNGQNTTQNSVINITGGELISAADYAVYLPQAGTTTISGGTIKGACGAIGMRSGTLNINDQAKLIGEGTGDSGQWGDGTGTMGYAVINIGTGNQNTYGDCTVNITGGTFIAEGKSVGIAKREDGAKHNITVSVTGGTFSDLSAIGFIAENADVNIELNKDIEIQKAVTLMKAGAMTTVNLNGYTIANKTDFNNAGDWETEGFVVTAGTLNIEGEGNVECIANTENDGFREVISAYGTSVVNLRGGNYKNYQQKNGQYDLIYARDNAVVNIYGGTYESGGYNDRGYWVLNLKDNSAAEINVYGGSFKNFNPCNHLCENPNANFVAEGYQVTCDGKVATDAHDLLSGDKTYVVSKIAQ